MVALMIDQDEGKTSIEAVDELIGGFEIANLVTESLHGDLRGRPMAIAAHDEGAVLYFLTRSDDEKLEEMLQRDDVSVILSGENKYVSISGKARLNTDLSLTDQMWSPSARLWFPEGPRDPHIVLVTVEPSYAECWDRRGIRQIELWWEAGKALLHGRKADDESLSGHHKVPMDSDKID